MANYRKKELSKLLHTWQSGGHTYRLIGQADHSPGYCDRLVIEKQAEDSLGDTTWAHVDGWRPDGEPTYTLLVNALLQALGGKEVAP